jgi:hypothetical protein
LLVVVFELFSKTDTGLSFSLVIDSVYPLSLSYPFILNASVPIEIRDLIFELLKDLPLEHRYIASSIDVFPEPFLP